MQVVHAHRHATVPVNCRYSEPREGGKRPWNEGQASHPATCRRLKLLMLSAILGSWTQTP